MDENIRFMEVIDTLKAQGLISGYVAVAEKLGTNKAAISDIKSHRKKLSLDMLRSLKISYPSVNLNWVIMGEGAMFISEAEECPEYDNPSLVDSLMDRIERQSEKIGEQRREIEELKRHLEKSVGIANIDSTAHAVG